MKQRLISIKSYDKEVQLQNVIMGQIGRLGSEKYVNYCTVNKFSA